MGFSPNQYAKLLRKWVDERTGFIKYLITTAPDPPNFSFVWTSSAGVAHSKRAKTATSKTTGFGVGLSAFEAATKAVGEALEIYAASHCPHDELLHSAPAKMGEDFLDPRQVGLYDRIQYRRPGFPFDQLNSRTVIAWTRGRWLDTRAKVWLPAFLTYFTADVSLNQNFSQVTTSGLATGTSLEDAALRGVCELIERDAFMITWLARTPARRLVIDAALDDGARGIVDKFNKRGLEIEFFLLNAGIDVPVVLSLIRGDGKSWPAATVGLGAHANPVIATHKSVLEQGLMGPGMRREMLARKRKTPSRADLIKHPLDHARHYFSRQRAHAFDFLEDSETSSVSLSALPQPKKVSLNWYVRKLRAAAVRVAVKDLTPPQISDESPFRVARVLGTGLQQMYFGYGLARAACPRLRRLGRNKLNPHPHPLA